MICMPSEDPLLAPRIRKVLYDYYWHSYGDWFLLYQQRMLLIGLILRRMYGGGRRDPRIKDYLVEW